MWNWGTGQYGSMMPQGEVYGRSITIGMEVRDSEGVVAANHINSSGEQIKDYPVPATIARASIATAVGSLSARRRCHSPKAPVR